MITLRDCPELYEAGCALVERLVATEANMQSVLRDLLPGLEVRTSPDEPRLDAVFYNDTQCGTGGTDSHTVWAAAARSLLLLGLRQTSPDPEAALLEHFWEYIQRVWPLACVVGRKNSRAVLQEKGGRVITTGQHGDSYYSLLSEAAGMAAYTAQCYVRKLNPHAYLDVSLRRVCSSVSAGYLSDAVPTNHSYMSYAAWTDAYQRQVANMAQPEPLAKPVKAKKPPTTSEKQPELSFIPYAYDVRCDQSPATT